MTVSRRAWLRGAWAREPEAPPRRQVAAILRSRCLARTFCSVCVERCPVEGALTMVAGRPEVDVERCDGCGTCQFACPAPSGAIAMVAP